MKDSLIERAVLKIAKSRHFERFAIRALLKANELLGLAIGVRLAKLRDSEDRFAALFAESEAHALQARLHAEIAGIVACRWDRLPERRRPHYRPSERYRILRIRQLLSLSHEETARMFRISSETVARWEHEVDRKPEGDKIGSLVRPQPPVRRYADVVRHLVKSMALAGFGGYETIAQTLARAGWKLSKRSVARILKEKGPTHLQDPDILPSSRAVRARCPNHIWMSDITEIPSLFGLFCFHLAVVLDVFSRFPLAARVFCSKPTAAQLAELVEHAVQRFGPPKHFISDQGSQFTASAFQRWVRRHGILHRFGAVGKTGSIAIIERLWRNLKELLHLKHLRPLINQQLEHRLTLGLVFYTYFRPHQGLNGAAPAEIYFGWKRAHHDASYPPRARLRQGPTRCPFSIAFLDKQQRLPYLVRRAA